MNNNLKLTIIIVNFNTKKYLGTCLDSILASSYNPDLYQVVVVDNASDDTSVDFLKLNYPRVIVISNRQNTGFAKANNKAIRKYAKGYVLMLNPDTRLEKNTIKEMIDFMDRNPSVGISTARVELVEGELDDACHRGFPTPFRAFCHFSGLGLLFPHSLLFNGYHLGYQYLDRIHEIDSCAGAFMMIRKQAGDQVNWLDEDYFWYGEDLDFCFRVKKKGWKVMFYPEVKIIHYKGISSGIKKHSQPIATADKKVRALATASRFEVMRIFYKKHYCNKYPKIVMAIVLAGINLLEKINRYKYL